MIKIFKKSKKEDSNKMKDFLYISAFPKSGSSFITLVISDLLQLPIVDVIYSHFREQDLYEPLLIANKDRITISKHHTLATKPNVELFQKYNITPIILTRKLPDVVISLRDHISKTLIWPHFHVPKDFNKWEDKSQFDFLIDFAIPWYLFFYVSWNTVMQEMSLKVKLIQYENFHQNRAEIIQQVLDFMGYEFNLETINKSMEKIKSLPSKQTRINQGVVNRGNEKLTSSQLDKIITYTKNYPDVDFKTILY